MEQNIQLIIDLVNNNPQLSAEEKSNIISKLKEMDKKIAITEFKLDRTEKVKRTTAILLEETIEELEQKRKAVEAQNKELEIETALERVRSKTMAMHNSTDVGETAAVMVDELKKLGIETIRCGIGIMHEPGDMEVWTIRSNDNDKSDIIIGWLDMNMHPLLHGAFESWREKNEWYSYELKDDDLIKYYDAINHYPGYPIRYDMKNLPTFIHHNEFYFNEGILFAFSLIQLSEEQRKIFKRFAGVFGQTYRRYLDLQKAEAQSKEVQIQLALERVRARTMAMHHSNELAETSSILFQQIKELGFETWSCGFCIYTKNDIAELWMGADSGELLPPMMIPYKEERTHHDIYEALLQNKASHHKIWAGKELEEHYTFLKTIPSVKIAIEQLNEAGLSLPEKQCYYVGFFKQGYLLLITKEPNEALEDLSKRFASVFDLTYTRFLDLQKAEVQAREAQIELALERVRAKTMAMQKSDELREVVATIHEQLQNLGFTYGACSIVIMEKISGDMIWWIAGFEKDYPESYYIPFFDHPFYLAQLNNWKEGKKYVVLEVSGEEKKSYDKIIFSQTEFVRIPLETQRVMLGFEKVIFSNAYMKHGALSWSAEPIDDEHAKILQRFAIVFEQTYTRFLDLQKAEVQVRESQIEAALERVRSRTLAMQKSDELVETAAVLFQQLIALGIEPNRLYIAIVKDEQGNSEFWITEEDGTKVSTAFSTNLNNNESFSEMFAGWKQQQKSLVINMQGEELQNYFRHLTSLGVPFKDGLMQKRRVQDIAYFSKGFIGMASPEQQPAETLVLLERFAAVFNLTFTRFTDLKIAEANALQAEQDLMAIKEARQKAEAALTELQSAQKQLIQSEKMASLGELTAGIAHEIQNPLNFVNNFSEVSKELLDEMREAIDKGDTEEAKEIMNDVIQNLEKINYHGRRADGIVKGMLQHSRSSSAINEPSDINALADEYLRLAYHGLRAKDKSFNATLKTDYDESIGNINIVPQDIGRVILNLITNAFYAVQQKQKETSGEGFPTFKRLETPYEPTVNVRTKKVNSKIEISVADNGNGISKNILDKIFQPFFTTKPTGQGTGLGLSLAYDIVKAHDGELKVETKEGEGSEFIIQLPNSL